MSPSVYNVLIDGVGSGEAEDKSSKRNHGNAEDDQSMPAVKTKQMTFRYKMA